MSFRSSAAFGVCCIALSSVACGDSREGEAPGLASAPLTLQPGAWQAEFTNPGSSAATAVDMPVDEHVVQAIDGATASVDIAVYGFDHPAITQAVLRAQARGVAVRFVGHAAELDTSDGMKAIQAAGVPMVLRQTTALMHHKLMIVDRHLVGFGSLNFTTYAADQNDENFVFADSAELAAVFQGEFDQMFAGRFGKNKVARGAFPTVPLEGGSATLYFSPTEQTSARLRDALASAQTRVYFMSYSFTLADIASDLVALHKRGVEVVGVFDKTGASSRYSQDDYLATNGVPVYLDGNEYSAGFAGGRLHDKVMIIDPGGSDPIVVTGSYNWSAGATDENDETLAILRGARFAAPYVREFCRIYRVSSAATQDVPPPTLCVDRPLVALTEIMANPDGVDKHEEYVEIANVGSGAADLSGWALGDATSPTRHVFAAGTTLAPYSALVVYGGPSATGEPRLMASSGQLSINNDMDTMTLRDTQGAVVDRVLIGIGVSGESVHRSDVGLEDIDFDGRLDGGAWGQHGSLSPLRSSPGLRVTGAPWALAPTDEPTQGGDPAQSDNDDVVVASALPNPVGTDRPEEYVTIVNRGLVAADLSGWSLGDLTSPHRHVFASGTILAAGATLKIYDGGSHADGIPASSGALSLNNDLETATLYDRGAAVVGALSWKNAAEGVVFTAP